MWVSQCFNQKLNDEKIRKFFSYCLKRFECLGGCVQLPAIATLELWVYIYLHINLWLPEVLSWRIKSSGIRTEWNYRGWFRSQRIKEEMGRWQPQCNLLRRKLWVLGPTRPKPPRLLPPANTMHNWRYQKMAAVHLTINYCFVIFYQ